LQVHVKLFASLRYHRPGLGIGESFPVELPTGSTVEHLVRHLGLPQKEVKLVYVNGRAQENERVLADGDQVGVFPPVGGG
jgi:molybdopterin converting factor small subunit